MTKQTPSHICDVLLKDGDIFLPRNASERDNGSPGYWNHAAIYAGDGKVIEAQMAPYDRVLNSDFIEFWGRYPTIKVVRHYNRHIAANAAKHAKRAIGLPYRMISSVFRRLRRQSKGENCVSTVRRAYKKAHLDYKWRKPDHILQSKDFVEVLNK